MKGGLHVRPVRLTLLGVLVGLLIAACSGGSTGSAAPSNGASPAGPATGATSVSIVDFAFDPIDVTVAAGSTVTWTNAGASTHTVKWSDGTPESTGLANGATYERTFDAAGTYPYVCGIHGSMHGTVTVTE